MIVCICSNVQDRQIKAALATGIDTLAGLKEALDIANCCGCCEPMVHDFLEAHHGDGAKAGYIDIAQVDCLAYAV